MKALHLTLLISAAFLSSCSTFEGLKDDISSGYEAVADTFAKPVDPVKEGKKKLPVYDGSCPSASIRPDLKRLVEFTDDSKPSNGSKVSEVTLVGIQNVCRVEQDNLVMQIELDLEGKTGPKARVKSTDKPSFAYPYFVAVTDLQGNVLSKEIFAASLAYGADKKELKQRETVFQNMPFPDAASGISYTIIVGFQLTEDQLAYNQRNPVKETQSAAELSAKNPAKPAHN